MMILQKVWRDKNADFMAPKTKFKSRKSEAKNPKFYKPGR